MACPDLRPYFKHAISRPMPHSFGVPVLSDWSDKADDDPVFGIFKRCGFWTLDEAAILYEVARHIPSYWLDIGGHTGWTAAHLLSAGCYVDVSDPMYDNGWFKERAKENLRQLGFFDEDFDLLPRTSDQLFADLELTCEKYSGVAIDGDHHSPHPLHDAQNSAKFLKPTGAILLHDAIGGPVQEAVQWLMENGFSLRTYLTPHVVACCWRGDFTPPAYRPDPRVAAELQGKLPTWLLKCA